MQATDSSDASFPSLPPHQVNEARDAFDVFDNEDGLLGFENVAKVLDKLGFQDEVGEASCTTPGDYSCVLPGIVPFIDWWD